MSLKSNELDSRYEIDLNLKLKFILNYLFTNISDMNQLVQIHKLNIVFKITVM